MAKTVEILLIFGLFLCVISASSVFDSVLDDISTCADDCRKTYSPHTYEKVPIPNGLSGIVDKNYLIGCCQRGCRFFSIMEFIYHHDNVNITQKGCISSCSEAYNKTDEYEACTLGCKNQIPQARKHDQEDFFGDSSIHFLYPLMYVHNMYSNMIDKMYHGMSVSWSFYMQADDGKVVVVKSQPKFTLDLDDMDDEYNTANYFETNLEPLDRSATPVLKNSQMFYPRQSLDLAAQDDKHSSDWLSCVSKKTGLPRLFLSLLLLMCAIMMIWLCLTAAITAPEQRVKSEYQKLSINGDLEYLSQLETLGIKISYPQDKIEASPLPIKIKVDRI
ncbi:hypothetical protein KUTeg_014664 [Tegillarca granosa]|uniref:Transmembrane protein 59 n=1 Tax=Tegillarca granosa TaxID=220873 RepID=A0ABQ9EVN3_TEGGR|nr:hypothetical protein KUTeg_014664 [Tegillarca granosa]